MSQRAVRVCRFVTHDIADSCSRATWAERHADMDIRKNGGTRALSPNVAWACRLVDERMGTAQHWSENNRVAALARLRFDAAELDVLERL